MAPLEVPRVPSPPPCFSPLCTFFRFAFPHCALFSSVHFSPLCFSPLCTGQTALLRKSCTAPTILQCAALHFSILHFCSSLRLTGLHFFNRSICTALNCSMNHCKTDPVDLFSEMKRSWHWQSRTLERASVSLQRCLSL